jgi:very-short-patch-repair endonuclease
MHKKQIAIARKLRRNMTPAEFKLWGFLRNRQLMDLKFRRQVPIGRYIVDFVCFEKQLVIELDGSQHLDNENADNQRTEELNINGFEILTFTNDEVLNELNAVFEEIMNYCEKKNIFTLTRLLPFRERRNKVDCHLSLNPL